jgi:hypothetical protein
VGSPVISQPCSEDFTWHKEFHSLSFSFLVGLGWQRAESRSKTDNGQGKKGGQERRETQFPIAENALHMEDPGQCVISLLVLGLEGKLHSTKHVGSTPPKQARSLHEG